MLLDELRAFVRANVDPHLQGLWSPDCETQLLFANEKENRRIPKDGNGTPRYDDTAYFPPLATLQGLGVSGWNYVDGRSYHVTIDLDGVNHAAGHEQQVLDDLVAHLCLLDEVEIIRSKSGLGYHVRLYFCPEFAPRCRTRKDHISVGDCALIWLSSRIGQDLSAKSDAVGVIAWIYHVDRGAQGFEIVKRSNAFMPEDWESEFPQHVTTGECEIEEPAMPVTGKHQVIIDALSKRGMGEWKDGRLVTHTHHLLTLSEDSSLKISGSFVTIATGKDGVSDRNCFMYPAANGSWRVYRFGKNTAEHESWWKSASGYTTTWFNKGREAKADVPAIIAGLAKDDELFHDTAGRVFVSTTLHSVKETLPLTDSRYRAKLRLLYTGHTGRIASNDHIGTAISQLEAIALLERPEMPVANRVAEHGGKLYIDLANRARQVIEVNPGGWKVVENSPVRFLRPYGTLPLPVPVAGGTLAELQRFVNVDEADLPLLLAFVVGCFHPAGPYSVLQVVGEQGTAKSSLMRLIHDLVDPQLAVGNTLPKDERDLLVSAQQRWLVSFDNVDCLSRKLSSLLCMLVTGAASANRKLFTDADQAILRAKRPIVITAIANVVTASDLLDRTLTLVLPPIPTGSRKSEFAIAQELRRDGVRGRIFGYILNGVAAALAGHAAIKRDDMPRLADFFSWATAAEQGLDIPPGSTIEAFKQQTAEESLHVEETQFGRGIIKLCKRGWKGSAKELCTAIDYGSSAREVANQLREIAPDLRRNGYAVEFRKSNGARLICLSAA